MYAVSINSDDRVLDVYNTAVFVDEGISVFEISESNAAAIAKSGVNNAWLYSNGVAEYLPIPAINTAEQNKNDAVNRLAATDWANQPDVYDPANPPHLTNRDAFLAYRLQVRAIAVNSVEGNLDWPTEPTAVWSS
jgi:hypothetical protein